MECNEQNISPYLPFGVKFISSMDNSDDTIELNKIWTLDGINKLFGDYCLLTKENNDAYDIKSCKLLLRPLSDLTKEIDHKGEKFVPLIDLYRLSNEYNYNKDLDYEFIDSWGAKGNILKVFHSREKDEYTEFIFSKGSFRKDTRHNEGSYGFGMTLPHSIRCNEKIYNQYKLHQLLFEWNFDVFGLIEKGLAVDINTLNQ